MSQLSKMSADEREVLTSERDTLRQQLADVQAQVAALRDILEQLLRRLPNQPLPDEKGEVGMTFLSSTAPLWEVATTAIAVLSQVEVAAEAHDVAVRKPLKDRLEDALDERNKLRDHFWHCDACLECLEETYGPRPARAMLGQPGSDEPCVHPIARTTCGYPENAPCHSGEPGSPPPGGRHQYQRRRLE